MNSVGGVVVGTQLHIFSAQSDSHRSQSGAQAPASEIRYVLQTPAAADWHEKGFR